MIGVTFEIDGVKFHSSEYDLVLKSTHLTFPEPKRETTDIPGRDGVLDLTGKLTGEVKYYNRTLTLDFVDLNDRRHYSAIASMLAEKIHAKTCKIILDKDSQYYYQGFVTVSNYEPMDLSPATDIEVTCDVEPYKYLIDSYEGPWKWDPFNFYTGVISKTSVKVEGVKTLSLDPGVAGAVPTFKTTGKVIAGFGGKSFSLPEGESTNYELYLSPGKNTITFVGNGEVEVEIERREL